MAADALEVLVERTTSSRNTVTVPEGSGSPTSSTCSPTRPTSPRRSTRRCWLARRLGLPAYANGNAEGYLFPSTYDLGRRRRRSRSCGGWWRWRQAADAARPRGGRAEELGYTPAELMIVASLVEAEAARDEDRGKVAGHLQPTRGRRDQRPAPDRRVGELRAAAGAGGRPDHRAAPAGHAVQHLHATGARPRRSRRPATLRSSGRASDRGDWYYYVTTNLRTGETKFASTYDEFRSYKREFQKYCETSDAC